MDVLTESESRTQARAAAAGVRTPGQSSDPVQAATKRSQDYLLSIQKPEGYWVGELMVDSTLVSDMVVYHHWDGSVDKAWERKAINHLFSMQLPDGGWNIYYGGASGGNATIQGDLALKNAGGPGRDIRGI